MKSMSSVPSHPRTRAPGATRSLLLLATTGALVAAGLTVVVAGPHALGPRTAAAPVEVASSPAEQAVVEAQPGTCLTWTEADAADITATRCSEPHLFEVAAVVDVGDRVQGTTPSGIELSVVRTTACTPAVRAYLDGAFDPDGRFTVGLINPGATAWASGDRTVRCGLQSVGRLGSLFPTTGAVAAADQSDVVAVGTCLGIDGTDPTEPVDCDTAHAYETVAVVDLATKYPTSYPGAADQDASLETTCDAAAAAYTGSGATDELTVFWDDLARVSWDAGSRKVNCSVGHQLAGGGFAPVTGDARTAVSVGASAAPTATSISPGPATSSQVPPGTPQDGASSTPVPAPAPAPTSSETLPPTTVG